MPHKCFKTYTESLQCLTCRGDRITSNCICVNGAYEDNIS